MDRSSTEEAENTESWMKFVEKNFVYVVVFSIIVFCVLSCVYAWTYYLNENTCEKNEIGQPKDFKCEEKYEKEQSENYVMAIIFFALAGVCFIPIIK